MATTVVPLAEGQITKAPFLHVRVDDLVRIGHVRWVPCPFCHQAHVKLRPGEVPEEINVCPTAMENYKIIAMYDITL